MEAWDSSVLGNECRNPLLVERIEERKLHLLLLIQAHYYLVWLKLNSKC